MKLKIECKTKEEREMAEEFLGWLSNSGEQQYWEAIECNALEGEPMITSFNYDFKKLEVELVQGKAHVHE